jgi:hypothetical protein
MQGVFFDDVNFGVHPKAIEQLRSQFSFFGVAGID